MNEEKQELRYRQAGVAGSEWSVATTPDEFMQNGVYEIKVINDAGTLNLPFRFTGDDVAQLVVSDNPQRGKLQQGRSIAQTLIMAGSNGNEYKNYTRTAVFQGKNIVWSNWKQSSSNEFEVLWSAGSHVNTFIDQGTYNIKGERHNSNDGLPITNASPGHTISAKLMVFDSSISGNGKDSDKCITQLLVLSNRVAGDGDVYIRTGRASMKNMLAGGYGWDAWSKLQQNVEVGQVTSLDSYIDNGLYSGVYTNGTTMFETFVMVVINNYAVAAATGATRSVSQFKYALNVDRNFSYKTRTGQGADKITWGNWVDLGAATTTDIQDGAITAEKLSADLKEQVEKISALEKNATKEKTALLNGDTIVGMAREVYSRQGKTDTATFLQRTTAGGTSISDGVATLKQIGGNIVKNLVDGTFTNGWLGNCTVENSIVTAQTDLSYNISTLTSHKYYVSAVVWSNSNKPITMGSSSAYSVANQWVNASFISIDGSSIVLASSLKIASLLVINLTEMFGAGNEPTKEECDKMFGTMDALPQGLTVAQPTGLKSTGYNQWNPVNLFTGKTVADNAIVDGDKSIAFFECLPCRVGAGENNGYVIGYGEGDDWSDAGIEVYLTPIYPMTSDGLLYAHKLEKDITTGTYIPQIKGYLLVVTPVTDKLCAHFLWSGDRAKTDYEEYIESTVSLPAIPQMSEWGLAGISSSIGTLVADTIDLDRMVYTKRIGRLKGMDKLNWFKGTGGLFYSQQIIGLRDFSNTIITDAGYTQGANADGTITINDYGRLYLWDSSIESLDELKNLLKDKTLYYHLKTVETYPIVAKAAPNYIGNDYGVEEFMGSKVPLVANILFYMRSLVSETRNFLDRLMAGLGTSDTTAVADRIVAAVLPSQATEPVIE